MTVTQDAPFHNRRESFHPLEKGDGDLTNKMGGKEKKWDKDKKWGEMWEKVKKVDALIASA